MKYTDEKGNVLYGFSQEDLAKTNKELRKTNKFLILLLLLVIFFIIVLLFSVVYIDYNNIITRLIYRS